MFIGSAVPCIAGVLGMNNAAATGLEGVRPTALSVADAAAVSGVGEPETPAGAGPAAAAAKPPAAPRKAGIFPVAAGSSAEGVQVSRNTWAPAPCTYSCPQFPNFRLHSTPRQTCCLLASFSCSCQSCSAFQCHCILNAALRTLRQSRHICVSPVHFTAQAQAIGTMPTAAGAAWWKQAGISETGCPCPALE